MAHQANCKLVNLTFDVADWQNPFDPFLGPGEESRQPKALEGLRTRSAFSTIQVNVLSDKQCFRRVRLEKLLLDIDRLQGVVVEEFIGQVVKVALATLISVRNKVYKNLCTLNL